MMVSVKIMMLIWSALTVPCLGFSGGPPLSTCVNMLPLHKADAQTTDLPYLITVSKNTYNAGDRIEVFVNTSDMYPDVEFFTGLMIQARRAKCSPKYNGEAFGLFTLESDEDFLGLINCQGGLNNTVAHKEAANVKNKTFTWIAPSTSVGHIYFRGTIVSWKTKFWTTMKSEFILDNLDSSTPESCSDQPKQENSCTNTASIRKIPKFAVLVAIVIWLFRS